MSFQTLGQPTISAIVSMLSGSNTDPLLDMSNNASVQMRPSESMSLVAAALGPNVTVRVLILQHCNLDNEAAKVIARLLSENNTIEDIDLRFNSLTSEGVVTIARGLARNRGVQTVNLLHQQQTLGEQCVAEFQETFRTNFTLTKIIWDVELNSDKVLRDFILRNVDNARLQHARKGSSGDCNTFVARFFSDRPLPAEVLRNEPLASGESSSRIEHEQFDRPTARACAAFVVKLAFIAAQKLSAESIDQQSVVSCEGGAVGTMAVQSAQSGQQCATDEHAELIPDDVRRSRRKLYTAVAPGVDTDDARLPATYFFLADADDDDDDDDYNDTGKCHRQCERALGIQATFSKETYHDGLVDEEESEAEQRILYSDHDNPDDLEISAPVKQSVSQKLKSIVTPRSWPIRVTRKGTVA